nr:AI-2E family transporter [uncultured Cellulosilyticum sp.]
MKNFWKNNRYFEISLYALVVIIISILFYRISSNTDNIAPSIMSFIRGITSVLSPIFYGLLIAYLFNPIMDFFERYLLMWIRPTQKRQRTFIRSVSIFAVYVCIVGTVILMFRYLIPQLAENLKELTNMLPTYKRELTENLVNLQQQLSDNGVILPNNFNAATLFDSFDVQNLLSTSAFDTINNLVSVVMSQAIVIASTLLNWVMGLVIAFYVLMQKETFAYAAKRVTYSLLSTKRAEKVIAIFSEGHSVFIQFFVGKFIDSFIIGTIAFVGLSIMKNPYALLLAVIVGVFNMIPYFGPILGAIPAVAITLFEGLPAAAAVLIFIIILQQFDGLVLGPKILGDSIGLSPFWIISGIIIGGALWGPLGMFFASPIIAVVLTNINRVIDSKLTAKDVVVVELEKPIPPYQKPQSPRKWYKNRKKHNKK